MSALESERRDEHPSEPKGKSRWPCGDTKAARGAWRRLAGQTNLVVGIILLLIVVVPVVFAPLLTSANPDVQYPSATFLPPTFDHLMGTDQYGRDMLARVFYGGRYTIGASIAVVILGGTVGTVIGLVAGYLGGVVNFLIMRLMDFLLAFPGILLALAVSAILGPSLRNAVISVAIIAVPLYARIVEGAALEVRNLKYVEASGVLGGRTLHILRTHILPAALPAVLIQTTSYLGVAALWVASLGFLGLSVEPPTPEWGQLLADGQADIFTAWWVVVFPGLFLALYGISVNMIGDGLRDRFDPLLHGER